jgi:hypothetical protein
VAHGECNLSIFDQIIYRQLDVVKNRSQEAGAERFTGMNGDCCYSPIPVPEEKVATSRSYDVKTLFLEEAHKFLAFEARKASHTEICWIPTNSSDGRTRVSSRQSSTTSRTRFIRVSRFFA